MFIIKFAIYFSISFFLLSIPINNRPVFNHLNKLASPYTKEIFSLIKIKTDQGLEQSKKWGEKLLSNTIPASHDSVKSKLSSIKKNSREKPPQDSYTDEERELLNRVLKIR